MAQQEISIRAAGVVPLRHGSAGTEVLVIHRPHRGDWSLPKGKLNPGEHVLTAAVRECSEETGLRPTLGLPLPTQVYNVEGRLKSVQYWICSVPDEPFIANEEVDEARWIPITSARDVLSYEQDAALVGLAAASPPTEPLILVRHAQATKRAEFTGSADADRPLAMRGHVQAEEIADLLAAYGVSRLLSSPAQRCVETLQPYAHHWGITLTRESDLSEEGHASHPYAAAMRLGELLATPPSTAVCTHRPVLPALMDGLVSLAGAQEWAELLDPRLPPGAFVVLHREMGVQPVRLAAVERHDLTR